MMRRIVKLDATPRHVTVSGDRYSLDMAMPYCGREERPGTVSLPWSPKAALDYMGELKRQGVKVFTTPIFDDWLQQEIALRESIKEADNTPQPKGTRLYQHQVAFAARANIAPCQYDASEVGTGKSISALAAVDYFRARRVLICCPKVVYHQWANYIDNWSDLTPIVFDGGSREKREKLLLRLAKQEDFALIISWDSLYPYCDFLERLDWDAIVGDEFHFVRNRKTKRFEALSSLEAPLKIALSGTPFEKSGADVFTFFRWVDPHRYTSYWRFAEHSSEVTRDPWADVWNVEGLRNEEIFGDIVAPYMRRLELSQLADIPEIVWEFLPIELSEAHFSLYKKIALSLDTENPLAAIHTLRRATVDLRLLGYDYSQCPKLDALENLHSQVKHLVVYSTLLDILEKARDLTDGLWLTGEVQDRQAVVEKFKGGGTLCMTATMGVGLDFPFCNHIYMLDSPWSYTTFSQAIGRIRRLSGGRAVVVYPYCINTIDERIVQILERKADISRAAMERIILEHVRGLE